MVEEMHVDPFINKEDNAAQKLKRSFQEILDSYAKDATPDAKRPDIRKILESIAKDPSTPAKATEEAPKRTNILRVEVSKVHFQSCFP
jgi:hypothetical protein